MSSVSSALNSTSDPSGTAFTGSSQFSSSLAQEIERAVDFASLPMEQMQNDLNALTSEQTAVQGLNTDFQNLQSDIAAIQSAITGTSAFSASSSSPAVATVSLTGTPTPGTYPVSVTSAGVYATSASDDGLPAVSDPTAGNISDASSYTLSVGKASYTITPATDTLDSLEQALNMSGNVQATIVNLGTTAAPDYTLSLEGTQFGDLPIQLTAVDGSNPGQTLLTAQTPAGSPFAYQVNGQPSKPIQSNTSSVIISPGVEANLLTQGNTTITVSPSTTALSNALSKLASDYNTAMTDLNKNRGQAGGALAGDSLVQSLTDTLQNLIGYSAGTSGISSLTSLGFSFDQNGVLSFDPSAFATATNGNAAQLDSFLGSSTTGGFLEMATNAMTGLEDPSSGLIPQDLTSLSGQITDKNNDISDQQDQINTLQTNLTQQMSAADAAIASLEQQSSYMQSYFQQMQVTGLENAGL